ncbi:MAG: hypothetical protein GX496_09320 [Firmicutes bacterium]|uniref:ATPase n=1 Tax=Geochorda subterranea TaxID=3109564 RepID=A0ABZ1BKJ9_9FIRM|nr:hypothetical protein [Limnochorda sp. LNt]NLG69741.1 hypothetical protein [Bacillota bacterium]WRP13375.1 hypothetical protein VLY81_07900 [Limnochorda sp. LNt]
MSASDSSPSPNPSTATRTVTVQLLLERLEHLIASAPTLPLGGRAVIRADEALELIERIRRALPDELRQASELLARREALLQEGQEEADRIVSKAEEYASRLVRESEVLRQAREEGEQLLESYRRRAAELEAGANQYADSVLLMVQQALEKTLGEIERHLLQVQRGRAELARRLQEGAPAEPTATEAAAGAEPPPDEG